MKIALALTVLVLAVSPLSATQADDETAIRDLQGRWDEASNRHDVKALSSSRRYSPERTPCSSRRA